MIDIDSGGLFTYLLFLICLGGVIFTIRYVLRSKDKIKDIKINPFAPVFGFLFFLGLWLADLSTLTLATRGIDAVMGINPVESSKVPALFIWLVVMVEMFAINYFFLKVNRREENSKLYAFNKILLYTQMLGLVVFTISSLGMMIFGYDSVFLGFYLLNLYHSTLPLIILTTVILAIDIK